MERVIEVKKWNKGEAGGCNACNFNPQSFSTPYPVYEITLRSMTFRLCETCKNELLLRLVKRNRG